MSQVSYAIQDLNSTINQFESNVDVHVNNIRQSSINVEQATKEIYDQISKFREDMEHGEQSQLAHENIIRIGSCGAYVPNLNLFDIVLSKSIFTESNFALSFHNEDCHIINADIGLNSLIKESANENNIKIVEGNTICSDCFDPYMLQEDFDSYMSRVPKDFNALSAEMEAFALCYNAHLLNKKATCLMTVVDSRFETQTATSEEREHGLDNMIKLALEASLKC